MEGGIDVVRKGFRGLILKDRSVHKREFGWTIGSSAHACTELGKGWAWFYASGHGCVRGRWNSDRDEMFYHSFLFGSASSPRIGPCHSVNAIVFCISYSQREWPPTAHFFLRDFRSS